MNENELALATLTDLLRQYNPRLEFHLSFQEDDNTSTLNLNNVDLPYFFIAHLRTKRIPAHCVNTSIIASKETPLITALSEIIRELLPQPALDSDDEAEDDAILQNVLGEQPIEHPLIAQPLRFFSPTTQQSLCTTQRAQRKTI